MSRISLFLSLVSSSGIVSPYTGPFVNGYRFYSSRKIVKECQLPLNRSAGNISEDGTSGKQVRKQEKNSRRHKRTKETEGHGHGDRSIAGKELDKCIRRTRAKTTKAHRNNRDTSLVYYVNSTRAGRLSSRDDSGRPDGGFTRYRLRD